MCLCLLGMHARDSEVALVIQSMSVPSMSFKDILNLTGSDLSKCFYVQYYPTIERCLLGMAVTLTGSI